MLETVHERPAPARTELAVALSATRVTRLMVGAVVVLTALGLGEQALRGALSLTYESPLFKLNEEQNLPTWYQAAALLFCAALSLLIRASGSPAAKRWSGHWYGLAAVFVFTSIDESMSLHERTIAPLRALVKGSGPLYYSWVVLGLVVVAVLALAYARFIIALPHRTRLLFLVGAATFVVGAIGMEMAVGQLWGEQDAAIAAGRAGPVTSLDAGGLLVKVVENVEEILEMLGVVAIARALVEYARSQADGVHLRLAD